MPAKTPIYLKAANNKKGKKFKLRDILSPDMISPPLGDFRHTIHIGKEGQHDVFGDISFLQGNYELLPGNQEKAHSGQFPGHNDFFRANSTSDSMFAETPSPVLKNAISLPTIGGSQALMLPLLSPVTFNSKQESFGRPKLPRLSCEPVLEEKVQEKSGLLENGTVRQGDTSWGSSGSEKSGLLENGTVRQGDSSWGSSGSASQSSQGRDSHSSSLSEQYSDWPAEDMFEHPASCELMKSKSKSEDSLSDLTGSMLSLQLDLGPSLLDEVLNVMDKNK